ncbi:MAG: 50S ribosomal protein L6 [Candidatus Margulisiibacteriota bacterium]
MARIGKKEITIPKGVEVKLDGRKVMVKGPKGSLSQEFVSMIEVKLEEGKVFVLFKGNGKKPIALQGLYNRLITNMIAGVTKGFEKELDLVGVGYRAVLQGKKLQLQLGYSHPVEMDPPTGIDFEVIGGNKIKIKGIDKQIVGHIAAEIRSFRAVEPYKGKGIRYTGEVVRRKAGKAAKASSGGGAK